MVLKGIIGKVKEALTTHSREREFHAKMNQRVKIDWFETDDLINKLTILYFYETDERSFEIEIKLDTLFNWAEKRDLVTYTTVWVELGESGFQTGYYQKLPDYANFLEEITTKQIEEFLNHYLSK